jgi:hypothetical protein
MNLSKNLTLKEAIKSNTASRLGLDNTPTDEHLSNLIVTAKKVFQPIRDHFGIPIGVSSMYRGEALNKAINGSQSSDHCRGRAIDIDADMFGNITNKEIGDWVKENLDFDQLIYEFPDKDGEPSWIHVGYRSFEENRNQILIATRVNGKVRYAKIDE